MLCVLFVAGCTASNSELAPYQSDGCSAFPDGPLLNIGEKRADLWLHCCRAHDYAYWQGGTREQRWQADRDLKNCVASVGRPKTASLMLVGVRVGGSPYWPTPFRWGFGWPYYRPYQALTDNERELVTAATPVCVADVAC